VDCVRPRRSLLSTGGLLSYVGTLEPSLMSEIRTVTCDKCHRPLMLIDFYGSSLCRVTLDWASGEGPNRMSK
jgi:hypothetical protein